MKLIGTRIRKKDIILGIVSILIGSLFTLFLNYPTINSLNCRSNNLDINSIDELNTIAKDKCINISGTLDKSNIFRDKESDIALSPLKEYSSSVLVMFSYEELDRLNGSFVGKVEVLGNATVTKLNTKPEIGVSDNISSNEQIKLNPDLIGKIINDTSMEFGLNTKVVNTFEVESLNRLNLFLVLIELILLSLAAFEIAKALDRSERFKVRRLKSTD